MLPFHLPSPFLKYLHYDRLILFRISTDEFVAMFKNKTGYPIVEPAHMELVTPTIKDAFTTCVQEGADRIIVSPFFLFPGRHWYQDIPSLAAEAAQGHSGVSYFVTAPLGLHELMVDIRQSVGSIRSISNSLYLHSIRPGNLKGRPGQVSDSPPTVGSNGSDHSNGNVANSLDSNPQSNGENGLIIAKLTLEPDIYESSRYESILLKEDLKNTNWMHNVEDKSDQSPVFDHWFEPLPEPFGLL